MQHRLSTGCCQACSPVAGRGLTGLCSRLMHVQETRKGDTKSMQSSKLCCSGLLRLSGAACPPCRHRAARLQSNGLLLDHNQRLPKHHAKAPKERDAQSCIAQPLCSAYLLKDVCSAADGNSL